MSQKSLFGNLVLWIIGGLVLLGLITVIIWGWNWITAPTAGKVSARQQIQSGSSRISAYNHFFDLCASIQGLDGQLAAQKALLPSASSDDRSRILTNISGIEGAQATAIAQYNLDARKSYTIGQFRSNGLPYQIPAPTKGEVTSCTA